jgi:MarR family transcriptional regulator for hemolysin
MPNMPISTKTCARAIIEVVPLVMRTLRTEMRQHRAADLSVPQFRTLGFLNRQPGSSLSAVAEHIGLTLPAMSTLVEGLVERNMVTRGPAPDDRRRIALMLTAPGRTILEATHAAAETRLAERLAKLPASDREQVVQAMQALRPLFASEPPDLTTP